MHLQGNAPQAALRGPEFTGGDGHAGSIRRWLGASTPFFGRDPRLGAWPESPVPGLGWGAGRRLGATRPAEAARRSVGASRGAVRGPESGRRELSVCVVRFEI